MAKQLSVIQSEKSCAFAECSSYHRSAPGSCASNALVSESRPSFQLGPQNRRLIRNTPQSVLRLVSLQFAQSHRGSGRALWVPWTRAQATQDPTPVSQLQNCHSPQVWAVAGFWTGFLRRSLEAHVAKGTRFVFIPGPMDPGPQTLPGHPGRLRALWVGLEFQLLLANV